MPLNAHREALYTMQGGGLAGRRAGVRFADAGLPRLLARRPAVSRAQLGSAGGVSGGGWQRRCADACGAMRLMAGCCFHGSHDTMALPRPAQLLLCSV